MIKLFNFLTGKKNVFRPLRKKRTGLYACGPTVYNYAHIGNLRTFVFEDILRRALERAGYEVRHVMNITDVDDKIIRGAAASGKSIYEFTKPYEKAFFADIKKLNIKRAWKYPRATQHLREMILLIGKLLKSGLAYEADGSIYFSVAGFGDYGKLSGVKKRKLKAGVRIDADEYAKQNVQDFVLWKAAKTGEPSWPAPFGAGRPGWHIECSAMSMKYLGSSLDIHAGGVDLLFPHHENEIAQSEGATGKKFARFFVEGEHLLVNGEKMAKSLGNVFTLRDIEARGFNPLSFRYLVLTSHYRAKLNFTWESLAAAQRSLEKLYDFVRELKSAGKNKAPEKSYANPASCLKKFNEAVFDDLDAPKALAILRRLLRDCNKNPRRCHPKKILKTLYEFDEVLGLGFKNAEAEKIPSEIFRLAKKREELRKRKLWRESDAIREKIKKLGYLVEDSPEGPKFRKIS